MILPDFAEQLGKFWILKNDSCAFSYRKAGTIAHDRTFVDLPEVKELPKTAIILDVGSYIGDTVRGFIDEGFTVFAFEPQEDAYICLCHNCPESTNWQVAAGDGRMVSLHGGKGGNMGGRPVIQGNTVKTKRLDECIMDTSGRAILIKIDVEGFEPAVLIGARNLLQRPEVRHVICEFNPRALERLGFNGYDILSFFKGWKQREVYRYYEENWDVLYSRV